MGENVKKYFKNEFRFRMFSLDHDNTSDFYVTCWQRNRSVVPLLLIRILVFVGCVSTLVASMVIMTGGEMSLGHWFIFMTHWGLIFNTLASGLACAVSLMALSNGSMDEILPGVVKLYWVFFNIATCFAFFITVFYWSLLTEIEEIDYALDPVLDVFIHGINSVFMFVLLVTSRHSTRLMHFYLAILVGIIYMIFTLIYYYAGGISPFGKTWIYPMLDWSKPGETVLLMVGSTFLLIAIHALVVAITLCRDALTKRCRENTVLNISNGRPNYIP